MSWSVKESALEAFEKPYLPSMAQHSLPGALPLRNLLRLSGRSCELA